MKKIEISRHTVGFCFMQVCVANGDVSDAQILEVCNTQNPSGTINGWTDVIRSKRGPSTVLPYRHEPVPCGDHPNRTHYLVGC